VGEDGRVRSEERGLEVFDRRLHRLGFAFVFGEVDDLLEDLRQIAALGGAQDRSVRKLGVLAHPARMYGRAPFAGHWSR
jgi:hypothetical protein